MRDINKKIAELVLIDAQTLNFQKWLREETYELALRIPHLDEMPISAILALTLIAANGEANATRLATSLGIDQPELKDSLETYCELKFAEETSNGYMATSSGNEAFIAICRHMVMREHHELKGRPDHIEELLNHLNNTSPPHLWRSVVYKDRLEARVGFVGLAPHQHTSLRC